MAERFEAQIGADIREFQRKIAQANRQLNDFASEVQAEIDVDISEVTTKLNEVRRSLAEIDNKDALVEINLAYDEFRRQIAQVRAQADNLDGYEIDVEIDALVTDFNRKLLVARAQALGLSAQDIEVDLDLNTRRFDIAYLRTLIQLNNLTVRDFVAKITLDYRNFQANIQRIAVQIRAVSEILGQQLLGALISLLPAISPLIASLTGTIASLGIIVGILVGQLLILTATLSAVALGFVGLAAVGVPTIKALFDETTKLNAAQQEAKSSFDAFIDTYDNLVSTTEQQVLTGFTQSFEAFNTILQAFEPLIIGVADSFVRLTEAFNTSIDTAPIQAIFDAFNNYGPEIFEGFVTGIGNFVAGLGSLIAALLPAASQFSSSFEQMTRNFADFTAGLSNNQGFQNFIAYTQENLPILNQAFGDFIIGLVALFGSFDELGTDFIVRLSEMASSFREFSEGLSENQQFQEFVQFIRDETPAVLDLIGNLINFLVNLGIAFGPVGSQIISIVNSFLEWTNSMLESSSALNKIVGLLPVILGGFLILLAPVTLFVTVFGSQLVTAVRLFISVFGGISKIFARFTPQIAVIIDDVVRLAVSFGSTIARIVVAAGNILSKVLPIFARLSGVILNVASKVLPLLVRGIALLSGPIGLVISIILTLVQVGIALYKNWETVVKYAKLYWEGVKTIVTIVATALYGAIQQYFGAILTFATKVWSSLKGDTRLTWNDIISFIKAINLFTIGKNIIQGLINGFKSLDIGAAVRSVVNKIPEGVRKFFKIKSPSRLMMEIGVFIPQGLAIGILNGIPKVVEATKKLNESVAINFTESINKASSDFRRLRTIINNVSKLNSGKSQATRFEAFESALQDQIKYNDTSLTLQRQYYLQFANQLRNGSAQQRLALKTASDLQLQILEERFNKEQQYLETIEKYEALSLRNRIRAIQSYNRQYKAGSAQNIAYDEQLYDLKKGIYEDLNDINRNYLNEVTNINNDLISEENRLRNELQKTYESRRDSLANAFGLFDQVKLTELVTFDDDGYIESQINLLENLRGQVQNLQDFNLDINLLQRRGVSDQLLEDLRQAGPKAAAEIRELSRLTDSELREYQDLYSKRFDLAGSIANNELASSRVELENQVRALRENALSEIAGLTDGTLLEIDELINGSRDRFNVLDLTLTEIARRSSDNVLGEFERLEGDLSNILQRIAQDTATTIGSILGGNSNFESGETTINRAVRNERLFDLDQSEFNTQNVNVTIIQEWDGEQVVAYVEETTAYNTNLAIKKG